VVLSFIYTRCQDARMCPLISAKFRQIQEQAGARPIHLVEVTLDPAYDRPPVLGRYGRVFGADPKRWSLVVGDADPTLNFAAQFGVTAFPDPNIGIIHAENTVIVGPDGRIQKDDDRHGLVARRDPGGGRRRKRAGEQSAAAPEPVVVVGRGRTLRQ